MAGEEPGAWADAQTARATRCSNLETEVPFTRMVADMRFVRGKKKTIDVSSQKFKATKYQENDDYFKNVQLVKVIQ